MNDYQADRKRFSGFADIYNQYRPRPPAELAAILSGLAGTTRPRLVVDLGCGTGLSTRYWADQAHLVCGVDPTIDMLRQARQATHQDNVSFRLGVSHDTGLPAGCADIVTCSQSFHWMEPFSTLQEARRILREGGVFAACDYDWPPLTRSWRVSQAFQEVMSRVRTYERQLGSETRRWGKSGHLKRMQESGMFCYTTEVLLHHIEQGDARRIVGLLNSFGSVARLRLHGMSDAQLGIDHLYQVAHREFGDGVATWYFGARVRVGVV
jgi:ubiquinone/menaquinone biosynthesis C-methylase UbiE